MSDSPLSNTTGFGLVTGRLPDLEAAFLARIASIRRADPFSPIDVLVGGVLQRPYLQRLIADTSSGLLNVRFSTLGELGIRLGERALIDAGRRPLPAMAARGFAAEVARATEATSGRSRTRPASPRRRAGSSASSGRRTSRSRRSSARAVDRRVGGKAAGLVDVYRRYLDGRADRYDGTDALAVADPTLFDGAELLVYGDLAARRARPSPARATRRARPGDGLPADRRRRCRRRARRAARLATTPAGPASGRPTPAASEGDRARPPPGHALRAGGATEPDDTVQLVSAPDPLSEVREAARTCLDWARDGILFREMAITYRDAGTYRPVVEAVFTEAGIPVYLDDGPSIAERPIGRRILALIDLIDSQTAPARRAGVPHGRLAAEGDARALRRRRRLALGVRDPPSRHRRGPRAVALAPHRADRARAARAPSARARPSGSPSASSRPRASSASSRTSPRCSPPTPSGHLGRVPRLVPAARRGRRPGSRAGARAPRPARAARRAHRPGRRTRASSTRCAPRSRRSRPATSTAATRARSGCAA